MTALDLLETTCWLCWIAMIVTVARVVLYPYAAIVFSTVLP